MLVERKLSVAQRPLAAQLLELPSMSSSQTTPPEIVVSVATLERMDSGERRGVARLELPGTADVGRRHGVHREDGIGVLLALHDVHRVPGGQPLERLGLMVEGDPGEAALIEPEDDLYQLALQLQQAVES